MKGLILAAIITLAYCAPDPQSSGIQDADSAKVAEIMDVMREMKSNMNNQKYPPGYAQRVDEQATKKKELENLEDALVHIMANSCSQFCQSGGYGDGTIIGTAPFCDGVCGRDCSTHCTYGNSDWSDYGYGCWSGNKICCCAKSKKAKSSIN